MAHQAAWHILDSTFSQANDGLVPQIRRIRDVEATTRDVSRSDVSLASYNTVVLPRFSLRITNLDHADPPNYVPGDVPRHSAFNANTGSPFRISAEPRMPTIALECETRGFDAQVSPIAWRLQVRHVMCRHQNQGNYRYSGVCEVWDDEWQGMSSNAAFSLFEATSNPALSYDYNANAPNGIVIGGHAILSVAALPVGCATVLVDYVHLRIGGTNPSKREVTDYLYRILQARDSNLPHMVNAIFAHENNYHQFADRAQASTRMRFVQKHHHNDPTQPNCDVRFDWPDDPEHFPSVAYDFGVGISQYTKIRGRTIGREAAWDWRENIRSGINEFLANLRAQYLAGSTWQQWAHRAWRSYNGSGPQAEAYANTLGALAEGQLVSAATVPASIDVKKVTEQLPAPSQRESPPSWPPFRPPGDYPDVSTAELPA